MQETNALKTLDKKIKNKLSIELQGLQELTVFYEIILIISDYLTHTCMHQTHT